MRARALIRASLLGPCLTLTACLADPTIGLLHADATYFTFPDREDPDAAEPAEAGSPDFGPDVARPDTGRSDAGDAATRDADGGPVGPRNPLTGIGAPIRVNYGWSLSEGPVWRPNGTWLMSNIFQSQIVVVTPPSMAPALFRDMTNQGNGLANGPGGSLLMCESIGRRVSRIPAEGGPATAIAETWNGLRFSSPNDVVVATDGTIYFTDPPYFLRPEQGRTREIPFNGLFRVTTTGSVAVEFRFPVATGTITESLPNGLELSPNESILYVSDSQSTIVHAFDVRPGGALGNRRDFLRTRGAEPDGIAVDVDGNVYVASEAGIEVYRPDATLWGVIPFPAAVPPEMNYQAANLAFGGADLNVLFVAAESRAYFLQMVVPGIRR